MSEQHRNTPIPEINVTPLIDVLLVLLIIFMVAVPLRPTRFVAQVPAEPERDLPKDIEPDPRTLLVTIQPDYSLHLNSLTDMGTVDDTSKLSATLTKLFDERKKNHVYRDDMRARPDVPEEKRIETTVFIKAPRSMAYNNVVKVIDGLKGAGATPIGLQLDSLN